MRVSLVNFDANWGAEIFVAMITGDLLPMDVHHVSSVTGIVA